MTRRVAMLLVLFGCNAELEPSIAIPRAPIDPHPDACASCHAEIVDAWRSSAHAHAWDDPVFRAEYDARPAESCRDCHAPASSAPGRATGIDCATCHLRDGVVLASELSDAGEAAHAMRLAPALRTEVACAACHQFTFTDDGVHDPAEALQNTLVEHYQSDAFAAGKTCRTCHMPGGSHAFAGIHDPEQLARAVDVDVRARRSSDGIEVDVRIVGAEIGHAFPTGDVFRRAVLRVSTQSGDSAELVMQRWLARTIDDDGEDLHVRTVDDTRVPPPGRGELRDTLHLPDDGSSTIAWELVLHRVPPDRARVSGLGPELVTRRVQRGHARWLEPTIARTRLAED